MARTVRTAVTLASLLHIPEGAEHPLQGSHRFAMFLGPDDDDIKPYPEPDVGEGAVLLELTSSSPKMPGAAAALPKFSSGASAAWVEGNPRTTPLATPQPMG